MISLRGQATLSPEREEAPWNPSSRPGRDLLQGDQGKGICKWPCPAALPHSCHLGNLLYHLTLAVAEGSKDFSVLWAACVWMSILTLCSAILLALFSLSGRSLWSLFIFLPLPGTGLCPYVRSYNVCCDSPEVLGTEPDYSCHQSSLRHPSLTAATCSPEGKIN